MLVKVLHGVFDRAPSVLAVPCPYLANVLTIAIVATAIAGRVTLAASKTAHVELLSAL